MVYALVTGANGAIGRHVVGHLVEQGWRVAGLGHGPVNWVARVPIDHWIAAGISMESLDVLAGKVGPPDLVLHLAGGSSVGASLQTPLNDFERSVNATMQILNWIHRRAPKAKLVTVSSAAVYGGQHDGSIAENASPAPMSPYGHHKLMMEQAVQYWGRIYGTASVIVRPFSVYGPGLKKQLVFDLCNRLACRPKQLLLSGTGAEKRDWISIRDIARLLVKLAEHASPEVPVFNACTGQATTVSEIAHLLVDLYEGKTEIAFDGAVRPGDPKSLVGSTARLAAAGLVPTTTLRQGLTEIIRVAHGAQA